MEPITIANGLLQILLNATGPAHQQEYFIAAIELNTPAGWRKVLEGRPGGEFVTTLGGINAQSCNVRKTAEGGWLVVLAGKAEGWEAHEALSLALNQPFLKRVQTYRFTRDCEAAICPGFRVKSDPALRYTFPLRAWAKPLTGLKPMRAAVDWALPFPFHIWHDDSVMALYGVDKSVSAGTLDFTPVDAEGFAGLHVYYPDSGPQNPQFFGVPTAPGLTHFAAGTEVTLTELIGGKALVAGDEPLLEAERLAASILLRSPRHPADLPAVAKGIADFYPRCELWEPDALGKGYGWFANMWVRTQTGPAKKRGEMTGYYDFGWGEGIAVEMMLGMVRHWKRTGETNLLTYVDQVTRSMELFKRAPGDDQPYFDRCDGKRFGDFLMDHVPGRRIWTHSLGHNGSQLLQLYQAAPDYPRADTRASWLAAATSMARFLARHQKPDGDLQDIFDDNDAEVNTKAHRITARASVCGLWTRLGEITGDRIWTERATRLARAVAPEINRYEYYNQMLDGIIQSQTEFVDGEAAYYVLEGLVPLYVATRDPAILALCKKATAFGLAWTYFYDVPKANNGIARGGQCCRMDDFPLLYPIGPAKAMTPLLDLHTLTGDPLFEQMAAETAAFIGNWQMKTPGQPWDGGMIHAMGQFSGQHWGPDLAGQVDTGMTTGNSLAAIEKWLARRPAPAPEPVWREPGQAVTEAYRQTGALRYNAEGQEIVGRNRSCFNNRPLYCPASANGVVMTGDRPFVRLLAEPYVHGGFSAAIIRKGRGRWFHDASEVESRYRCGRMSWRITDADLPGVAVTLAAVPLKDAAGFALRLDAAGLEPGDQLVWAFGGATNQGNVRVIWDPIFRGNPDICKTGDPRKPELALGMMPEWCRGNQVSIEGQSFRLAASPDASAAVIGRASREGKLLAVDASASADPVWLVESKAGALPMSGGVISLHGSQDEVFFAVAVSAAEAGGPADHNRSSVADPAKAFTEAAAYLASVEVARTETPEPRLDAALAAVCHTVDASCDRTPLTFRPIDGPAQKVENDQGLAIFRHGCMAFPIHFLGWRVIFGATMLGWHDWVKGNAAFYARYQVKEDAERIHPQPDPNLRGCHESRQSRLYGRGHIRNSPGMYNTQTQFFDQTLHDWRWTADPGLERILRPAMELQLEWARVCFDPDDDGLYESYINSLPTDSVWYNGGGSVEESAYAYYGHLAARDMARRAEDVAGVERHQQRADKIKRAMNNVLWRKERGHYGLYVEQGGHGRVHEDAWVYSQFLPIDAGVTTSWQALQALYYTEWALERIPMPYGGELCQPSNWVPSKWSVRDMFNGDSWHLALAYFQAGLADEGYSLLLGVLLESAYAGAVPGGFSHIGAGTDFADSKDMFARAVVEGLFGYVPDYPNGQVLLRPMFPSTWPKASIQVPDYRLDFHRDGDVDCYQVTLARKAAIQWRLPVRAKAVKRVILNGGECTWSVEPGIGCSWVVLDGPISLKSTVTIEVTDRLPQAVAVKREGRVGQEVALTVPQGRIVGWKDEPFALEDARVAGSSLCARLAAKPGHHLIAVEVELGSLRQWQVFKLNVTDPVTEAVQTAKTPREAATNATWTCLDLSPQMNGDVRTIFQQQYLSPRPLTCSVRLGTDGYSAWCFPYWGNHPPLIDFSGLSKLACGPGRIRTPQQAVFAVSPEDKNVAFTSLWDNWPRSVTVPVHQRGETVWMLVSGSTFPMQLRIANAVIRFRYADGVTETLELVPPENFWSLSSWGGLDYNYETDAFALPKTPPPTVPLGTNCRAMALSWKLRPGVELESLTLETLSQEVVIGLMGVSIELSLTN